MSYLRIDRWVLQTAAEWSASPQILFTYEAGIESDTGKAKLGNGLDDYATLSYLPGFGTGGGGGDLLSTNNLSDVANAATALSNLGGLSASTTSTQDGYFNSIFLRGQITPSHYLNILLEDNLTNNRNLQISVGDANRSMLINGNVVISGTHSGTNTGDQNLLSVLTNGNDAGGNDITGVLAIFDASALISVDVNNRILHSVDGTEIFNWGAAEIKIILNDGQDLIIQNGPAGPSARLIISGLTDNRTFTFPDADGKFVLE